jgi:hypothetical protein
MKALTGSEGESLPSDRGRYLLWLMPPHVSGDGHYVHFSWKGDSFCIRDYVQGLECRQHEEFSILDFWRAAKHRIHATGDLFVPVGDTQFWVAKLKEMSKVSEEGLETNQMTSNSILDSSPAATEEQGGKAKQLEAYSLLPEFAVKRRIDSQLADELDEAVRSGTLQPKTVLRLARWCKTDGIYADGMEVAKEISLLLFGTVIDRDKLGL